MRVTYIFTLQLKVKKMEILKENKNLCFEVDVKSELVKSE
jgi:nitroimidazol reductase NimA-like FMN-containing flavoprotein (pyridoxamine 5'-phosphate oxidase superfamily)